MADSKEPVGPRVPLYPLDQAVALGCELGVDEARAGRGWFRALAHHPNVLKGVCALVESLLFQSTVPIRLRELMIMRIAWVTQSSYEWAQHWRIARNAGVPDEDLLAVRDWRRSARLQPADRAVLGAVDDTLQGGKVSDAVWHECAQHLDRPALIEMTAAIGFWHMFSELLRTLEVPLEEGVDLWPPDGKSLE